MNIWEAYCTPAYYNIYIDLLVAKGMKRESAEKIKILYSGCLQRIKESCFAKELKAISDKEAFLLKLQDIFEIKWKEHFKHKEMFQHFYEYLKFLDSIQCLHNDFINEAEKKRLANFKVTDSLTNYELEYMIDGKLVALMNPTLLAMLYELITEKKLKPTIAALTCYNFYNGLINMSVKDYAKLINNLWHPSRRIRKGGRHNQIKIIYPDNTSECLTTLDALKKIVLFYGFNEVLKKKLPIRDESVVVKYVPVGKEGTYELIEDGKYILNIGNAMDRLKMANTINVMFGKKLDIELV